MYSAISASFSKHSVAVIFFPPLFTYSLFLSFVSPFMALQISCRAYWDAKCCDYTAGKGCTLCTAVAMMKYRANLPYKQRFKGKPQAFLTFALDNSNSSGSMYSEAVQISLSVDKTSPPSPVTVSRMLSVLQQYSSTSSRSLSI